MSKYVCKKPGPKSIKIINRDHKVASPSYTREYSFVYEKAKGCYIWDVDGRKYLDFAAGIAVMNIGHTNPVVEKAIHEQIKKGSHVGFGDFYAELPVKFMEKLTSMLPKHLNKVFLSNSGTEAVEAMYKLARWHTGKKWVIAFKDAFHGRTMGSLSLTNSKPVQKARFDPFMPVKHVPYPNSMKLEMSPEKASKFCLQKLEDAIKTVRNDCAAIVIEPIQGEGGYIVPPKSFIKGVRRLCNKYGLLLCADEVQSGCYRTGKFLAIENFGVKADIVAMSKAIGGGVPLGATVANEKIMDWVPGSHNNTFGGNLLACAAGIATLDYMKSNNLGNKAKKMNKIIMKRLKEMKKKYVVIRDIRGIGMMIGVQIIDDDMRSKILCKSAEKGLLLLSAGNSTIRICPPLILTEAQAKKGLDILDDAIGDII